MDQQLVSQISQRAGISPDQATQAAQAVVQYLKGKLPGPIGAQLDSALGGQAGAGGAMGNLGNMGGSMGNTPGMSNTGDMPNTPTGGDMGAMGNQGNMGGNMGGSMGNQTDPSLGGMTGNQQP